MKIILIFLLILLLVSLVSILGILGYFTYLMIMGRGDEIPPPPGSSKAQFDDWFNKDITRK